MTIAPLAQIRAESLFRWPRPRACASAGCSREQKLWERFFVHATTLNFRGSTFCFPSCFERELQRELERMSARTPASSTKARRIPVGLLMISRGTLTTGQLWRALNEQKQAGCGRIGEWLTRLGCIQEGDIAAALALQWSTPLLRRLPPLTDSCGIPIHLLRSLRMVPIHFSQATSTVHIAFADEIAYPALIAIEQMLNLKTKACLTTQRELNSAFDGLKESRDRKEKVFRTFRGPEEIVAIASSYAGKLHASEVRMVVCGRQYWLRIIGDAGPFDLIFAATQTDLDEINEAV